MDRWGYPHGLETSRWSENVWYSDKRWKLVGTRDFFHWVFLWSLQPNSTVGAALASVQADVLLHTSKLLGLRRDISHECWWSRFQRPKLDVLCLSLTPLASTPGTGFILHLDLCTALRFGLNCCLNALVRPCSTQFRMFHVHLFHFQPAAKGRSVRYFSCH